MQTSEIEHVGTYFPKGMKKLLVLKKNDRGFFWEGTEIEGKSVAEAVINARKALPGFDTLKCGFLYTLPERDEHGMRATFAQMRASYNSPSGRFFEPSLGHLCFVQGASDAALSLLRGGVLV